jgi:hypothetical protein
VIARAGVGATLLITSVMGAPTSIGAPATPVLDTQAVLVDRLAAARRATAEATAACAAQRWADCLVHLDEASRLRPQHPGLLIERARALVPLGRAVDALGLLDRVSEMGVRVPATVLDLEPLAQADPVGLAALRTRNRALSAPMGDRSAAFALEGPRDMVPEGLAWDPLDRVFYLGGVHRTGIVRIDERGAAAPFVTKGTGGLASALGLRVASRARLLYVASSGLDETADLPADARGRATLLAYALPSGRPAGTWSVPDDGEAHAFGDLTLDEQERPILSDSRTGAIYRATAGSSTLDVLLRSGRLVSPQGLVVEPGGRTLLVADYALGLVRVSVGSEIVAPVEVPETLTTLGIDGLMAWKGDLIAIQNGVQPARVVQLGLDRRGRVTTWRVLQANLEGFDEPTLGVIRGDELCYVANSHWNRFEKGRLPSADQLAPPLVLRTTLRKLTAAAPPSR